ncbi:rho GTPase-activating protein 32-like isoform X1 [Ptychodera flava]|uniref:rho GTPase-activating protein 32-like isoform X1 n=3 Tax=Ptychodera flava TaxID=63121 RepID=UPI00396A0AE7
MASSKQELQRGQRLRKVSEAENDSKTKTNTIRVAAGNSMFYTKVPLHRIDTNVRSSGNVDQTSNRTSAFTRTQASVRIKKMAAYHDGSIRFPKLNECAHFHYENVEFGQVQVLICNESDDEALPPNHYYTVQVTCQKKKWTLKRCYEDFRVLDKHLHRCIFDRRYSQLVELPKGEAVTGNHEAVRSILSHYLSRFSQIAGNMINCAPVLNWMEMDSYGYHCQLDNHGNHLIVSDESAINIPAVAAAHVVKRYVAQASDELSLEVGEFVSVIDMPPVEDTNWWRGKKGFEVGFFPSQCVQVIGGKVPTAVISNMPKMPKPDNNAVLRKHGKLITFLRSFMLARPAKRRLKQSGILRERVYGCDLGEHLMNSEHDIPPVLKICTDFIETHGIVDGIYRLSGVASNIQRLRQEFDSENDPDMADYINDIHSVSSVLKLYFRELPNPLLTYQLYDKFAEAIAVDEDRLLKITDVIQQLPPPHYRTVEYLMKHLSKMSTRQDQTGMHSKNLAIVWAPNLLRSRQIETASMAFKKSKSREIETGLAAFMEIRVQSIVVEYLIRNVHMIFSDKVQSQLANNEKKDISGLSTPAIRRARPKSLILSTPTKLLSLEEARARSGVQSVQEIPVTDRQKFIEVGGGPAALPKQYHTVIDLPYDRKKHLAGKSKKSPSGWKALFRSRPGVDSKRKLQRKSSVQPEKDVSITEKKNSLRSVRSAESLVSGSDTSDGANSLFFQEADVSPRRGSESSLPKATSHNSFFEGDSALAAMATNAMATPPESMFAKPARRPRVPQRQRSHSENPPVDIDVEFALGGVELRKKRMRHSDTPIRSGMIVRDVDYLAMSGKSGSPSKERNRNGLWLDGSTQALPRSKRLSDQSPTNSNRSSRSSQSSNSPESKSERHRVSAVGVEETSPSKSRQPKESSKNRISVTVELLSTTELDSESQQKRNSKNIDDSNSGDNEQKVPVITKTEPSHETVTLNVRIPPYVPGHRIIRLPDQERVALATEDNFRLTPYNTLESNMSLRNFDQSNDEELVKTPTATDNSFNLETVMSQFDSMREKYLRQGSVSPALSNSDDGMPSPQPDRVSPVFLESYVPSMSNPTNASIALDSDKTGGSNLSPTT